MTLKSIDMDDDLWKEFRKKCAMTEVTMKGQLSKLIKSFLGEK